jgi:hypothetical protein
MSKGRSAAAFLMKSLRQLGFFSLSLRADGKPDEDHRVLALFRNRAELKKAYGGLQEESFRLKDLIKQQEAATQRAQDLLATLEGRLGAADTAYAALVFYQLRRLWQSGRERVTQLIADLARQQEDRERRAHLAQHNRQQFARRQAAENQVRVAEELYQEARAQVSALEAERAPLTRFWHYFKRRALERRLSGAAAAATNAGNSLGQARLNLEAIAHEPAPEFAGLSLQARRAINLAAIAYAEVLCLRLAPLKTPLLKLARESTARRETPDDYGSPRECVLLMGQIARAQHLLSAREGLSAEIRVRHERLQRVARYRGANDVAPIGESLTLSAADAQLTAQLGADAARLPNVLAEDTWDLFRILLR